MPREFIEGLPYLSYDSAPSEKYWSNLSSYLIKKHGYGPFYDQQKVEEILQDGFQFLVEIFRSLILSEKSSKFFFYIFWLHESSVQLFIKLQPNYKSIGTSESEFSIYRRILKLILEQGCEIDLEWGKWPEKEELLAMDEKIQDLIYLGNWMYAFAEFIAFQKMVEECHKVYYKESDWLVIDWQHHYGLVYDELSPQLSRQYVNTIPQKEIVEELKHAIESCFGIEYDFAGGQIFEIKRRHNPDDPSLQTIQPHILPENLSNAYNIDISLAKAFYAGLTISRENKLSIEESIYKPYSMDRYLFRPILIYKIGGEKRALVGEEKFAESLMVLATNAMQWNAMQKEWLALPNMQLFVNKKGQEHDKLLEDEIEAVLKANNYLYLRNIKSFKRKNRNNIRIDNATAGEIDFIIIHHSFRKIFVVDAKYNRSKYEAVGYRNEYTNFLQQYEPQLEKKIGWIKKNLIVLEEHFSVLHPYGHLNINDYEVEGIFIINTPTFYMLNGGFKTITLNKLEDYLVGKYGYPTFVFTDKDGEIEFMVSHPYFNKPIIF